MNEQYIISLYNQLGGESKFGQFEDFKSLITSDPSYQKAFHDSFGESTLGPFNDFSSLVSIQQQAVQPKKKDGGGFLPNPIEQAQQAVQELSQIEETQAQKQGVSLAPQGTFLRQMQRSSLASESAPVPLELPSKLEERKYEKPIEPENPTEWLNSILVPKTFREATEQAGEQIRRREGETPEFLKPSIDVITPDFLNRDASIVKNELEYQLADAGFKFNTVDRYGFQDIIAIAPNGKQIMLSIGGGKVDETSNELKNFIKENSANLSNFEKIQKLYTEENKKYTTQKAYDAEISLLNKEADDFDTEQKNVIAEKTRLDSEYERLNSIPEYKRNTPEFAAMVSDYEKKASEIEMKFKDLYKKSEGLKEKSAKIEAVAGKYTEMKAKSGTPIAYIWNKVQQGLGGDVAGVVNPLVDFVWGFAPLEFVLGKDEYNQMRSEKAEELGIDINELSKLGRPNTMDYVFLPRDEQKKLLNQSIEIDNAIRDDFKKMSKYGEIKGEKVLDITTMDDVRNFFVKRFGSMDASKEYMNKMDEGTITGAIGGLAQSSSSMIGPAWLRLLFSYAQATDALDQEMQNDPDLKQLSENEKQAIKGTVGVIAAKLENAGLKGILKNVPFMNNFVKGIVKIAPKNATPAVIRNIVDYEIKNVGVKTLTRIANGFASEAWTGGLQEAANYEEMFKDVPSTLLEQAYNFQLDSEYWSNITKAAVQEGIGGFMITTPIAIAQAYQKNGYQGMSDDRFAAFEAMHLDSGYRNLYEARLKNEVNQGKITSKESEEMLRDYDLSVGLFRSIPPEITSVEDKKLVMDLLVERNKLNEKKKGKDDALSKPIQKRIDAINEQLTKLSEDALQKQAAGEVPVQSEAGVSETMVEGEPQAGPQVTPEQTIISPEESKKELEQQPTPENEVIPTAETKVEFTEQNRTRQQELTDALAKADKRRKNITVGETTMSKADAKAELDALNQKEKASQQPVPTTEVTPIKKEETKGSAWDIVNKEEKSYREKQEADKAKAENDIELINNGDQETIDKYFKKSGYTEITGNETDPNLKGKKGVYKRTGGSIIIKSSKQKAALDSATNISKKKIQGLPASRIEQIVKEFEKTSKKATPATEVTPTTEAAPTETAPEQQQRTAEEEADLLDQLISAPREEKTTGQASTTEEKNIIRQAVDNAVKAISRILPNTEIVVHETNDDYVKATGDKTRSSGLYVPGEKKNVIHINLQHANRRTVGHEVFHAVLLRGIKDDAEAQRLTKAMLNSVMKSLKESGKNQELLNELEDFASNYDENIQNEEKLAELFGMLADNYPRLTPPAKNVISRFLERLAKLFGLKPMTDKQVIDFMNTISQKVAKGEEITEKDISKLPKSKKITEINKRFQADFSDPVSKLSFVYDKNGEDFNNLEKQGFITKDKSLSDFDGKYIFLHQPDAAFSGLIYKNGQLLVEGKGGVYYPIKFHKDGYFWASTSKTAKKMADDLNKVMEQNGGTIYMALTSAPNDKLLSSTTMSNAILDFFSSKAFDTNFQLNPNQLKNALILAANNIKEEKKKNKKGEIITKTVGLNLGLNENISIDEIQSLIKGKLNPDNSTFADRKNFAVELIRIMAENIKNDPKSTEQFAKLFSEGIQNKYFKGVSKTGKLTISAANMTQALSEMFTEPILKDGVDREKGGQVYAIIELSGKVKPVPSKKHESYPMAVQSDSKNKVKLHILTDRQYWYDVFEDFETNEIVAEDRRNKIYPTSGVSTMGLRLNTSKAKGLSPRQQKTNNEVDKIEDIASRQQKGKVNLDNIVKQARANGYSEEGIRIFLERQGLTNAEIDNLLGTQPTTRTTKLDEGKLPGYDEMMDKVDAMIARQIKRGIPQDKIAKNLDALLRKFDAYTNATDAQKKALEQEARNRIGADQRRAPSLGRILGAFKDITNLGRKDKTAILNNIMKLAKDAANDLANEIKAIQASGKISVNQFKAIQKRVSKVNFSNERSIASFVDYITNVFKDAEYANKLTEANKLRSSLKGLSKNKDKNGELRELAKRFSEIDPAMVENIDDYLDMASKIEESTKGSRLTATGVRQADIVSISTALDYINEAMKNQQEVIKERLANEVQNLMGVDVSDLSYEKLMELVELMKMEEIATGKDKKLLTEQIDEEFDLNQSKGTIIKNAVKKMFDTYSSIIEDIFKTGLDPFVEYDETLPYTKLQFKASDMKMVREFMNMDLNTLTAKEALMAVDALNNFLTNRSTAGMGAVLAKYTARQNAKMLQSKNIVAKALNFLFIKGPGRFMAEQFVSLPMLFERMFKSPKIGLAVMRAMGVNKIMNGAAEASTMTGRVVEDYLNEFSKRTPNGKAFNDASNIIERGMVAFMSRTIVGTDQQRQKEFNDRKRLIEESIEVLSEGTAEEQKKAELYQEVYDKLLSDAKTIDDVKSKADKTNVDAVDWWVNEWSKHYDDLADASLNYYNTKLDKDVYYTTDRYSKLDTVTDENVLQENQSAYHFNNGNITERKAGSLRETKEKKGLPKNDDGKVSRYINLSFDSVNASSLYDALTDIKTIEGIKQVKEFQKTKEYNKIVPTAEDRKILNDRITLAVRNIRQQNQFQSDEIDKMVRAIDELARFSATLALAGPTQIPKQTISIAFNTLVNGGVPRLDYYFNKSTREFIQNSGRAIANRGPQSQVQLESINKMMDEAARSTPEKAMKLIKQANELWLKIFLANPDAYIAKASWLTYYEKGLKDQGIDTSKIDYSTHEINDEAADYAQMMVDRQQNITDTKLAGKIYSNEGTGGSLKKFIARTMLPLASFRINQYQRISSDATTLTSKTTSLQEKGNAARSLAAFGVEQAIFKGLTFYLGVGFYMLADRILRGGGEQDEEEEQKKWDARYKLLLKGQATSAVTDVFSPVPPLDVAVKFGFNSAMDLTQDLIGVAEEDKLSIYTDDLPSFAKELGMYGIAIDKVASIVENVNMARTGKFTDKHGHDKYISEDGQEILKWSIVPSIILNLGLLPGAPEFNNIMGKVKREIQHGGETLNQRQEAEAFRGHGSKTEFEINDPVEYNRAKNTPGDPLYELNKATKEKTAESAEKTRAKLVEKFGEEKVKAYESKGSSGKTRGIPRKEPKKQQRGIPRGS